MSLDVASKADWLAQVGLFKDVDRPALERIAERCGEVEFDRGYHIVRQGQVGNGLFLLVRGSARVVHGDDELARLGPGDFFGELAVLDQEPRMATVIAEEPVTCLALASWDLVAILETEPRIALNLLQGLARRIRSLGQQVHRY